MAKNYDNYGYDDNGKNNTGLVRRLLIVVMVVIAIVLIIYLVTSCTKTDNNKKPTTDTTTTTTVDYEGELLTAGKRYFDSHNDQNPVAPGECSVVELQSLVEEELIDANKFNNCNQSTTYLKECILEDERKQYTPWVSCVKYSSDSLYDELKQGTTKDIVADKTYVEFKFIPLEAKKGGEILGEVETMWKSDIPYQVYKSLSSTKYYRYRDKLYQWDLIKRTYYSVTGEKDNEKDVKDYYASSPKNGFSNKTAKTTGYKWYTATGTKTYYTVNGEKKRTDKQPSGYPYYEDGISVTRYLYKPTKYYVCATSANGTKYIYQTKKCGEGNNPTYNYTVETVYSCANETNGYLVRENIIEEGKTCVKAYNGGNGEKYPCDITNTTACVKATTVLYYWYKLGNEQRTYYPSKSTTASGEKVYYTSSPVSGAIKDESTKTTVYKWFSETKSTSTKYTATAPSGYYKATKSSEYKWTDWSDWGTKDPKANDGRDRTIETKTKIKLQEIKGTSSDGWENLTTDYLTEEQLIKTFVDKGYKVNSLEDITNNGQIKYQLVTYVRNKKENK